jgi:hypothetical protein
MLEQVMTLEEQEDFDACVKTVRSALSALRLTRLAESEEDVAVAVARIENWLAENDRRWSK